MQAVIPWPTTLSFRTRTTNFATTAEQVTLRLFSLDARMQLLALGLPVGRKSSIIAPPSEPFSHRDYLRGLIDADGSVGFTSAKLPFVAIGTASPLIAAFVCAEILRVTGARRTANPNKRDGQVNLMIASDPAAAFARWTPAEDAAVLQMSGREAARQLGRTVSSVSEPFSTRRSGCLLEL